MSAAVKTVKIVLMLLTGVHLLGSNKAQTERDVSSDKIIKSCNSLHSNLSAGNK